MRGPNQNGYAKRFNARLRDEILEFEISCALTEAHVLVEAWRRYCKAVGAMAV